MNRFLAFAVIGALAYVGAVVLNNHGLNRVSPTSFPKI
jgi:hypothetical protein